MKTITLPPTLLSTAICQQQVGQLQAALCFELPVSGEGELPDWIPLIPVGEVEGRDGRKWHNPSPQQVIERTKATRREQPLDYEHATEIKAPKGEPAPAAGWFSDYRIANGFIEGRLQLNATGKRSVQNREYRYVSPVFRYTSDGEVHDFTSAALTNTPNLLLPALNQQQPFSQSNPSNQELTMTLDELLAALRAKLSLADDADADSVLGSIDSLKGQLTTATNRAQTPSLDKFVPRSDYDATLQRATNAEQKLADWQKAETEKTITAAVDAAINQGKITPADKDYHIAACRQEGGLERFAAFVESSPVIAGASGLDGKQAGAVQPALNAEMQTLATLFGNSVDDLKQHGGLGQ